MIGVHVWIVGNENIEIEKKEEKMSDKIDVSVHYGLTDVRQYETDQWKHSEGLSYEII